MNLIIVLSFLFLIPFICSLRLRFSATLLLSILQIYTFSFFGFYPSLALLFNSSLWTSFFKKLHVLFCFIPTLLLMMLLLVQVISLLWSSNFHLAFVTIIYELLFLFIFASAFSVTYRKPKFLCKVILLFSLIILVQACLVIIFRIYYQIRIDFLKSDIANYFINPNALFEFIKFSFNNGWDKFKSGGVLLNANIAACFLGASSFVVLGLGIYFSRFLIKLISVILWFSVFFTGSKAGVLSAICLPLFMILILIYSNFVRVYKFLILSGCTIFFISFWFFLYHFWNQLILTTNSRILFWKFAFQKFKIHPILGLGFGGWEDKFSKSFLFDDFNKVMPPHNTLVYLWAQSGLLAFVLGLLFMLSILWFGFKTFHYFQDIRKKLCILCMICSWLWIFFQGMGTNFGLIGGIYIAPIFATSLGFVLGIYYNNRELNSELIYNA